MNFKIIALINILFICTSNVNSSEKDSSDVIHLHNTAYALELINPSEAIALYDSAASISNTINYRIGEGRSYNYMAIVYFEQGQYLKAKTLNQKAIPLFKAINYQLGVAACLINLGNIELYLGKYDRSMNYYLDGTKIYESLKDHQRLLWTYNNISALFLNNQQGQKSYDYALKANTISTQIKDSIGMADSFINLANASLNLKDSLAFLNYSRQAYFVAQSTNDLYNQLLASNNLANQYIHSNRLDTAEQFTLKTIELAKRYKNPYNLSESMLTASKLAYQKGLYMLALNYLQQAKSKADAHQLDKLRLNIAHQSYLVNKAANRHQMASSQMALYAQLKDSINQAETMKYIHLLEQKFENTKKEQTIESQRKTLANAEKILNRNRMLFITSGIILILLGLSVYYLNRFNKQATKLHSEQVKRLKIEQKNIAIKALVEGQEQERIRLARELHDGVSGGLAAIKLFASNQHTKNKNHSQKIEHLLDNLSQEVREMSHNLMPGELAKGGLTQSVSDLIYRYNHNKSIEFDIQFIGPVNSLPDVTKLNAYRIIQELLKNVHTHAKATECFLQLSANATSFNICCEDNGIGMLTNGNGNGIGMKNIHGRLELLNGQLDCQSSPDNGTAINIEIPIERT